MEYCCQGMWKQIEIESDDERLFFYRTELGEYGLVDRKDSNSYAPIAYCPWCGKILTARVKALQQAQWAKQLDGGKRDENGI